MLFSGQPVESIARVCGSLIATAVSSLPRFSTRVVFQNATAHVAIHQERETAKHVLLNDTFDTVERVADAGGGRFVVRHDSVKLPGG
jgi:hypothetical protein